MSKNASRIRRNPLGPAVASLMVMLAPSSLAATARAGESTLDPVVVLMPPGSFSGSFETACLDSVEALSATVNVTDTAGLGRQSAMAVQTKGDETAPPQEK